MVVDGNNLRIPGIEELKKKNILLALWFVVNFENTKISKKKKKSIIGKIARIHKLREHKNHDNIKVQVYRNYLRRILKIRLQEQKNLIALRKIY